MKLISRGLLITVVPLVLQLSFMGWLWTELNHLYTNLERISHSKEVVSETLDLVRRLYTDYFNMNTNGEHDLFDPETTRLCSRRMAESIARIRMLTADEPRQKANTDRLYKTANEFTQVLNWALEEQKQGRSHWVQIDEQCYFQVYRLLVTFLKTTNAIINAEDSPATISVELDRTRDHLLLMLAILVPVGLIVSLISSRFYTRSIRDPLLRMSENGRLLSEQKPLLPLSGGSDELSDLDRRLHLAADSIYELLAREKSLIANASETICSLDAEGVFARTNESGERLLGSSRSLLGKNLLDVTLPEHKTFARERLAAALAGGSAPQRFDLCLLNDLGEAVETEWSVLWSETEQLLFCVVKDVGAARKIERVKKDFLNMIADDLKAPLLEMRASLALIGSGGRGAIEPAVAAQIAFGEKTVSRLLKLVDNLLDFRQLESGKMEVALQSADLLDITREASSLLEGVAEARSIRITTSARSAIVNCDKDKMLQTLLNLISNAIKFSPDAGHIEVALRVSPNKVTVEVRDEGPGVPPDFQEKIFQPFEQVQGGKAGDGVGLGLAICRMIVTAHGGEIGMHNGSDGRGAVFWFTLPR